MQIFANDKYVKIDIPIQEAAWKHHFKELCSWSKNPDKYSTHIDRLITTLVQIEQTLAFANHNIQSMIEKRKEREELIKNRQTLTA